MTINYNLGPAREAKAGKRPWRVKSDPLGVGGFVPGMVMSDLELGYMLHMGNFTPGTLITARDHGVFKVVCVDGGRQELVSRRLRVRFDITHGRVKVEEKNGRLRDV